MATRMAMMIDLTKCTGCRGCQVACKQWNQLPAEKTKFTGSYQNPPKLSGKTWTLINFIEPEDYDQNPRWLFRKQQCLHCAEPTCVEVCPTGAARIRDNGIVYIDQNICAGCKYCVESCPYMTPHFDHDEGTVRKCRMCFDRVENGLQPACVTACASGAMHFGPRDGMVALGKKRVQEVVAQHPDAQLYGETQMGGLGVLYVLAEKPETYGLDPNPQKPTAKILARWLFGVIPGLAIMYGAWRYFTEEPAPATSKGGK